MLLPLLAFTEVTEFGHLASQSVEWVPYDEYQLVVFDSVIDGMCCGYGDRSALLYCNQDGSVHSRTVQSRLFCQKNNNQSINQSSVVDAIAVAVRSESPKPDTRHVGI
jgi:hypothetical protein